MKKLLMGRNCLVLLLALALCLTPVFALAQSTDETDGGALSLTGVLSVPRSAPDDIGIQVGSVLTIGNPTAMTGHFGTDLFGSNTADLDIRGMVNGYATVDWIKGVGMVVDGSVVASMDAVDSGIGRVYTFTLNEGLTYNDGTPITAKDYVFSILLSASPQLREIGGSARSVDLIYGYQSFASGTDRAFQGVRLLSDNQFSVTLDARFMPYFYGLAVVGATPYPYSVIAPGADIVDDGDGAYVDGEFTAALLQRTMLDPASGYVYHPRVSSGPYQLDSYDPALGEARLQVNQRYKGNYEGQKPHIETIVYKTVKQQDMVDQLATGGIDLINKLTDASSATKAQDLVQRGQAQSASYERSGLAMLAFDCANSPTSSEAVRRAIAHCVDKDALATQAVGGGRGIVVHGYYGLGQWMVREQVGPADAPMTAYDQLEELHMPLDLDAAAELLGRDGWAKGEDGYLAKDGQKLTISWAKTKDNPIADALEAQLEPAFEQLGIELVITEMPFADMMALYYSPDKGGHNMFYLASNFSMLFDPYYEFSAGEMNPTGINDQRLTQLALAMRNTEPADSAAYVDKWMQFQARFAQVLPMAPLYSNAYLDVYANKLMGYAIAEHITCADAILYAWIEEPPVS